MDRPLNTGILHYSCPPVVGGVEEVLETLRLVQNLYPVGVAARDTRECLLIQAGFLNLRGTIVEKIIMDHLKDLENRRYEHIAKTLSVPFQEILSAISVLQGLEPKPGRSYSDEETIYNPGYLCL